MKLRNHYSTIRFILGDQLNPKHSWFNKKDDNVLYVVAELKQETGYVKHHVQKVCAFFLAMENFANELEQSGHHALHLTLRETHHFKDINALLYSLVTKFSASAIEYQRPDEYRVANQLAQLNEEHRVSVTMSESEHFLLSYSDIESYVAPKKHNRMETFYRKMRVRFNVLMDDNSPLGGQWNYDKENRDKLKPKDLLDIPEPLLFSNDTTAVLRRLDYHKVQTFGRARNNLLWPISRSQSLQLLNHFCEMCLPCFGRFQDAMTCNHPDKWTLYHSRLSFALNTKMISPREVIDTAVTAFEQSKGKISLSQIEGFVRQILGWREYVRCVYWANMPGYQETNHLDAQRKLPDFFWNGNTKMNCIKHAVGQSLDYAYAHHIQRLMITGNFCMLAGIHPKEVDAWYLGVYIDAIEWVEMPNTRGMSQFADGGYVATKPYSAGGNYVNKMSDYCKNCRYKVTEKASENACPLNSMYWHFMQEHRSEFATNQRIGMVYRSWDKQETSTQQSTLTRAAWCLDNLEKL